MEGEWKKQNQNRQKQKKDEALEWGKDGESVKK